MVYRAPPPSLSAYTSTLASTSPSAVLPSHASPRPVSFRLDSPPQQRHKRTAPRPLHQGAPFRQRHHSPRTIAEQMHNLTCGTRPSCYYFRARYVWWWSAAAATTTTTERLRQGEADARGGADPTQRGGRVVGRDGLGPTRRSGGAWLVHLRERERRREAERGACRSGSGRESALRARCCPRSRARPRSRWRRGCVWADTSPERCRRIESTVRGAVQYLAPFLRRVSTASSSSPCTHSSYSTCTSGGATQLVRRRPYPRRSPGPAPCAPNRRRPLVARVFPPHLPLPPLSMVPRRAVATAKAHEETVVDGKDTMMIRRRPSEAREMPLEAVGELCEEDGAA
ncbi:hypothetical protein C8R45DRAFT_558177 [Mycena sanguinolenta]|nr:hypothetical protein C8R45DRAFT_558177 [Mycena sanguinolenta]